MGMEWPMSPVYIYIYIYIMYVQCTKIWADDGGSLPSSTARMGQFLVFLQKKKGGMGIRFVKIYLLIVERKQDIYDMVWQISHDIPVWRCSTSLEKVFVGDHIWNSWKILGQFPAPEITWVQFSRKDNTHHASRLCRILFLSIFVGVLYIQIAHLGGRSSIPL